MTEKHHIEIKKTATYYTLGKLKSAKNIWFVLHGYGYSAQFFIEKFKPLLDKETLIVAPEGLSKFYLKGVDGKIGASWMTKEDREHEINDYVNYLNELYQLIIKKSKTKVINVFGFSQGGATACRWATKGTVNINQFILWSSVFPDDMDFDVLDNIQTFFVYGTKDKYVTKDRIKKLEAILPPTVNTIIFEGEHDIPNDVLIQLKQENNW